ncbi:MAG TPA: hypothetical protein VGA03_08005 [Anaerolineales bacterium]
MLGLASSCNLPAGPGTPGASPTASEMAVTAQITRIPERATPARAAVTRQATETSPTQSILETATALPTALPTATPFPPSATPTLPPPNLTPPPEIPLAAIQILSPGPASKVASPFLMRAYVPPGPNGVVRIELQGEDGRLLMREVRVYGNTRGAQVLIGQEVTFGISAVAEVGRLQISVQDENGQVMALSSVDLILLSIGEADFNPPGDLLEPIFIQTPQAGDTIQGGILIVSGLARPRTDQPLMIDLKAPDGKILGTRQVAIEASPGSTYGTFTIDVPYTVSSPARARLFVWERGDPIPGMAQLSSLEVMLSP